MFEKGSILVPSCYSNDLEIEYEDVWRVNCLNYKEYEDNYLLKSCFTNIKDKYDSVDWCIEIWLSGLLSFGSEINARETLMFVKYVAISVGW